MNEGDNACIELHTHTHAHTRMCNKFQCMIDSIKLWNVKWAGKQLKCAIQNKKQFVYFIGTTMQICGQISQ